MTGPPPDSIGLRLPSGERSLPPHVQAIPDLEFPAYVSTQGGGVVASFLGRRSTALTIALALLQRRLHEGLRLRRALSYAASGSYFPLSTETAHLTLGADCSDEHAMVVRDQLMEELQRLAADGPEDSEVASVTDAIVASWAEDPLLALSHLDVAVTNELLRARQMSRQELREEYRHLTPAAVAAAQPRFCRQRCSQHRPAILPRPASTATRQAARPVSTDAATSGGENARVTSRVAPRSSVRQKGSPTSPIRRRGR